MKKFRLTVGCMIVTGVMVVTGILPNSNAGATTQAELDAIKRQLIELQNKIKGYDAEAKRLAGQARTLENQIAIYRAEENAFVAQIALSQARHDELVVEIELKEKRISENSEMIGYIVAQFYYNDEVSTIERLASSENLAGFIDEEARLSSLTDTLSGIVKETKELKARLEEQREEVRITLLNLGIQKQALADKRAQQQQLLDATRGQESEFQRMTTEAKAERIRLEAAQRQVEIELCRIYGCSGSSMGDGTKGGYPRYLRSVFGSGVSCPRDNNKYNNRFGNSCQCVSYVAWRVYDAYRISLNIPGNANNWDNYADSKGIPNSYTVPKAGSVGMHNKGDYGHVVWVEAVSGARIFVSEYNGSGVVGDYNEKWIDASAYDRFIYFGEWH